MAKGETHRQHRGCCQSRHVGGAADGSLDQNSGVPLAKFVQTEDPQVRNGVESASVFGHELHHLRYSHCEEDCHTYILNICRATEKEREDRHGHYTLTRPYKE